MLRPALLLPIQIQSQKEDRSLNVSACTCPIIRSPTVITTRSWETAEVGLFNFQMFTNLRWLYYYLSDAKNVDIRSARVKGQRYRSQTYRHTALSNVRVWILNEQYVDCVTVNVTWKICEGSDGGEDNVYSTLWICTVSLTQLNCGYPQCELSISANQFIVFSRYNSRCGCPQYTMLMSIM